jgi:hypothetical protein
LLLPLLVPAAEAVEEHLHQVAGLPELPRRLVVCPEVVLLPVAEEEAAVGVVLSPTAALGFAADTLPTLMVLLALRLSIPASILDAQFISILWSTATGVLPLMGSFIDSSARLVLTELNANRTLISKAGSVQHIGQFFFDEEWNNRVMNTTEYANNEQSRTLNNADSILTQANADGNNAFVSLELVGESIEDGLLGYISAFSFSG